jgi:hypothetical protein
MNLNSENDNVLVSRSITFWFYFVALLILKSLYIDRDKRLHLREASPHALHSIALHASMLASLAISYIISDITSLSFRNRLPGILIR